MNWKWPLIYGLAALLGVELGCAVASAVKPARRIPSKTLQVYIKPGDEDSQAFACMWMDETKTVLGCGDVEVFMKLYFQAQDSGPDVQKM